MNPQQNPQMMFPGQPAQPAPVAPAVPATQTAPQMAPTQSQNPNAALLGSAAMTANQVAPVSPNKDVPTSTQSTLLISELRDNVVIMKDGSRSEEHTSELQSRI